MYCSFTVVYVFCVEIFFLVKLTRKPNTEEIIPIKKNSGRDCFGISCDFHFVELSSIINFFPLYVSSISHFPISMRPVGLFGGIHNRLSYNAHPQNIHGPHHCCFFFLYWLRLGSLFPSEIKWNHCRNQLLSLFHEIADMVIISTDSSKWPLWVADQTKKKWTKRKKWQICNWCYLGPGLLLRYLLRGKQISSMDLLFRYSISS